MYIQVLLLRNLFDAAPRDVEHFAPEVVYYAPLFRNFKLSTWATLGCPKVNKTWPQGNPMDMSGPPKYPKTTLFHSFHMILRPQTAISHRKIAKTAKKHGPVLFKCLAAIQKTEKSWAQSIQVRHSHAGTAYLQFPRQVLRYFLDLVVTMLCSMDGTLQLWRAGAAPPTPRLPQVP